MAFTTNTETVKAILDVFELIKMFLKMPKWLVGCTETSKLARNWPKELSVRGFDENKHEYVLGLLYGLSVKVKPYVPLSIQSSQILRFSCTCSQKRLF